VTYDRMNGASTAISFADVVRQHHLVDRMFQTSDAIFD
jgi:hypothetical protein